jgi:hypothetical protein
MNVHLTRPRLGPIGTLPRAIARRWPALAVASVAVALPLGVAFANSVEAGPTRFLSGGNDIAVVAAGFTNVGLFASSLQNTALQAVSQGQSQLALDAEGGATGIHAHGSATGVEADGSDRGLKATSDQHVAVEGAGTTIGVLGNATQGIGVDGFGTQAGVSGGSSSGPGVTGTSSTGPGVLAQSTSGPGVQAQSTSGNAVLAQANTQAGTFAAGVQASGDEAVVARGNTVGLDAFANGTGVAGFSNNEVGGDFAGKEAPIRLRAATTVGAPTSGLHHSGELYVDKNGDLFYCKADGTPGTWKKVVLQ